MADDVFQCLDRVFGKDKDIPKLQSWSCKVAHATSTDQIDMDLRHKCNCSTPCCDIFANSYGSLSECKDALLELRTERTEGKSADERIWLWQYLYNNRTRSAGEINVMFRLDGVTVCSEFFTVALGFNYPNRRIAGFVRLIKVNKLYMLAV